MWKLFLLTGIGGFLGSVARFFASRAAAAYLPGSFPIGTFLVNVLGCFLIGIFYGIAEKGEIMSAEWRIFLTVGFCGGFTTFSAFAFENFALLRDNNFFQFAVYSIGSVVAGLLAVYLGMLVIKFVF